MAATSPPTPILFHYEQSIYSHKVLWYLHLQGIRYYECIQPGWLPRPDLTDGLHINYRRIPILAIGRDIYCDTRIILDTLEQRFGREPMKLKLPSDQGVRKLFESHTMFGGTFWRAVALLPLWEPGFLKDPKFIEDRGKMVGRTFDPDEFAQARPEALAHMRIAFEIMETTFLADGRDWILGNTDGPTMADIDAVYPLQWIIRDPLVKGGTPAEFINAERFPRTIAWIDRFLSAVTEAEAKAPKPTTLYGEDAVKMILSSDIISEEPSFEHNEPIAVNLGDIVTVTASDNAPTHSDTGTLRTLSINEICIENDKSLRLHFPRWCFTIQGAEPKRSQDSSTGAVASKKTMKLIYHPHSPYSRKVYMYALELGLDSQISLEKVVVCPIPYPGWSDNNEEVSQSNPMAKIPTLVPEAHADGIYDSTFITEYFDEISDAQPAAIGNIQDKWRLKTLHACANGILDAHVLIVYENKIRAENNIKFDTWIKGQQQKINRGLDRLEMEAVRGTLRILSEDEVATAADVAVAAALGFTDITQHEWRPSRPQLTIWFSNWEQRSSYIKTRPEIDWKSGKSSVDSFAAKVVTGK